MVNENKKSQGIELNAEHIQQAFEKLFGADGKGVRRFQPSGLRHVKLTGGAELIEQNPNKRSRWAELARKGHRIAWAMRDGQYLARIIDGEVEMLDQPRGD